MTREHVMQLIDLERDRQDKKWGANRSLGNLLWAVILGEEVGEVSNALLEGRLYEEGTTSLDLEKELTQVAAVAIAWLESLDKS